MCKIQLGSQNYPLFMELLQICSFFQFTLLSAAISSFENHYFPSDSAEAVPKRQMIAALNSIH